MNTLHTANLIEGEGQIYVTLLVRLSFHIILIFTYKYVNSKIIWLYTRNYLVIYKKLSGYIQEIIWLHTRNYLVTYKKLSGYIQEIQNIFVILDSSLIKVLMPK